MHCKFKLKFSKFWNIHSTSDIGLNRHTNTWFELITKLVMLKAKISPLSIYLAKVWELKSLLAHLEGVKTKTIQLGRTNEGLFVRAIHMRFHQDKPYYPGRHFFHSFPRRVWDEYNLMLTISQGLACLHFQQILNWWINLLKNRCFRCLKSMLHSKCNTYWNLTSRTATH